MGCTRLQGLLAGLAAGTVATFGALTLLPAQAPADASVRAKAALQQTSTGAGIGGVAGLIWGAVELRRRRRQPWQGWRRFVVRRKQPESCEITSFELVPVDREPLPRFQAGQFLTVQLAIPGKAKPLVRTYSLSDFPGSDAWPDHYRISVKREPAPKGLDVPPGVGSNFLHDQVQEGTTLNLRAPAGSFVLDRASSAPIVLVSNGVGITPMLAMLKAAVDQRPERTIWFVHGCRNSEHHAFRSTVAELAAQHSNVNLHVAYSRPLEGDNGLYQSRGYVDGNLLNELIKEPASYYLCGSPAFMDSLVMGLETTGVPASAIRFERFSQAPRVAEESAEGEGQAADAVSHSEVVFSRSNCTATWDSSNPEQSLLELAEDAGLQPAHACRAGVCGTCSTRVVNGKVAYLAEPTASVPPGSALICIARPASETLELEQ